MSIISLDSVRYSYKSKYQTVNAVNGISYEFEKGLVYSIVGSSGSGKSTLLSLMAALDFPAEGDVNVDGTSTRSMDCDEYRRDKVAVIYQNFNLLAKLTVLENAELPLELRKTHKTDAAATAKKMLRNVGLDEEYERRFPAMLSGGEQQRVAIARALASGADIILADEPTGNLDEENTEKVADILVSLAHDQKKCVIIVTHDMKVAAKADEVLKMQDGRLV